MIENYWFFYKKTISFYQVLIFLNYNKKIFLI